MGKLKKEKAKKSKSRQKGALQGRASEDKQLEELLVQADARREKGNMLFAERQYEHALEEYKYSASMLDEYLERPDSSKKEQDFFWLMMSKVPAELNCCACFSKLGKHEETIEMSSKIISYQTIYIKRLHRAKAFFRRGMALAQTGHYLEAFKDLKWAEFTSPEDKGITRETSKVARNWENKMMTKGCSTDEEFEAFERYLHFGELPVPVDLPVGGVNVVVPGLSAAMRGVKLDS